MTAATPHASRSTAPLWPGVALTVVQILAMSLGSALAYAGWLGWDHTYQFDPVTGIASGPYEAWQVVGCGLTIGALACVGGWFSPPVAILVIPASFTVVWSVPASSDETGLWLVGAMTVAGGTFAATALLATCAARVRQLRSRRHQP